MSPLYLKPSARVVCFNSPVAAEWAMWIQSNTRPTFRPSDQQDAITQAWRDTLANIVIKALAGSGKSSQLKLLLHAKDMFRSSSTTHQLGKQAIDMALNRPRIDKYKAYKHLDAIAPMSLKGHPAYKSAESVAVRLLGLVKANLSDTDEDTLDELATRYGLSIQSTSRYDGGDDWELMEQLYPLIPKLLEATKGDTSCQDFDDMLWLPIALDLPLVKYDELMVDESQDLNACQIELVMRSGHRHTFVGDENQAIYAFRGADAAAMQTIEERLAATPEGVTVLPLTVTRRCPRVVVTLAQAIVPNYEAAPECIEGHIRQESSHATPNPGDMVLARTNAILISSAFHCLAAGTPARIQGKDIGAGLKRFILQVSTPDTLIPDMLDRLFLHQQRENLKLLKARHADEKIAQLQDKVDCVVALCDAPDISTVADLALAIDNLFDDTRPSTGYVLFSSVHKAKGLEADTVRILEPEKMPHPMAQTPTQYRQELNCLYVAITRPKQTLIFHGTPASMLKLPEPPKGQVCPTCELPRTIDADGWQDCPRCGGEGVIYPIALPPQDSAEPEPECPANEATGHHAWVNLDTNGERLCWKCGVVEA